MMSNSPIPLFTPVCRDCGTCLVEDIDNNVAGTASFPRASGSTASVKLSSTEGAYKMYRCPKCGKSYLSYDPPLKGLTGK